MVNLLLLNQLLRFPILILMVNTWSHIFRSVLSFAACPGRYAPSPLIPHHLPLSTSLMILLQSRGDWCWCAGHPLWVVDICLPLESFFDFHGHARVLLDHGSIVLIYLIVFFALFMAFMALAFSLFSTFAIIFIVVVIAVDLIIEMLLFFKFFVVVDEGIV